MSFLPRVTATTRERVTREFDDHGPRVCTDQVVHSLERSNPEILDMILKCARDVGNPAKMIIGFAMFYLLLMMEASSGGDGGGLQQLPRVSADTRDLLVRKIDEQGPEAFVMEAVENLERDNPELLQMAHAFAANHEEYLRIMQGFALMYQSLVLQLSADRSRLH
jgi:hypothetical protein